MKIYPLFKRACDVVLSGIGILVLVPVWMPIAVVLKLTGDHDVFYGQTRIGLGNRHFKIWKFVTMVRNAETMAGGMHTTQGDPRVTRVGRFLRKTKLNELPQIFNILFGDMSIVGPRPQVDETFAPFSDEVKARIYTVRPGLTGIGSIVFRDEEHILSRVRAEGGDIAECYAKVITPYKGAVEMWYLDHFGFWTDVKLIAITAWVVIRPASRHLLKLVFRDLPEKSPELVALSAR